MPPTSRVSARFFTAVYRYLALPPPHRRLLPRAIITPPTPTLPPRVQGIHIRPASTSSSEPSKPPQPQQTHYTLFPRSLPNGPPPAGPFAINLRALHLEYLNLQRLSHPDRHPTEPDKSRAEGVSALINDAYRTLSDPLWRAQYLLTLRGIDVAGDEKAKMGGGDAELLMEVMDVREGIEGAGTVGEVEMLRGENEERVQRSVDGLGTAFRADDLRRAAAEAVRLRYWVNIREALDVWEEGRPVVLGH